MISSKYLIAWLIKLKNPAIITGILYIIAFFLIFPYLIQLQLPIGNTFLVLLGMLLAVVIVSALLNWAYLLTMIFPIAAALILFFTGWTIYILSPGIDAIGQILIGFLNGVIGDLGASGATGNITAAFQDVTTIGNHIGQFFITMGAAIYVHSRTLAGKVNYVAIGMFITVFALLGVAMGLTGLSGVAVFLVLWLMFYIRMQGNNTAIADMQILFKIVATLVVLIGSGVMHFSVSYLDGFQSTFSQFGEISSNGLTSVGVNGNSFLTVWHYFWTIGLLVGAWNPKLLWKIVPNKYIESVQEWLGMVKTTIKK